MISSYTELMEDLSNYEKEVRPWGNFERFTLNEPATVKIITVSPEQAFSLQTHSHRAEFWRVLGGYGKVTLDDAELDANIGDEFFVAQGSRHRATGGPEGLTFLEIAFGQFDENDIIRLEDNYGRT